LIYNPASGQRRQRGVEQIARAAEILSAGGVETEMCATTDAGSAIRQTQQAVVKGFDTVIACGGDGTVNEVPRELHPGVISYQTKTGAQTRWFIVAAGVGADAQLMYRTAVSGAKDRYGIYAYFLEMARMAWRRRLPMLQLEWQAENGAGRKERVALVMALRAGRFPGILRRVRLGAALLRNDYRLMIFKTSRVERFLNFFTSIATGWNWKVPDIELAFSASFRCTSLEAGSSASIHCEVDGEPLGTLPVEVKIEPRTFRLLMPH
jgi:diacylglycerol kinase family enzyme